MTKPKVLVDARMVSTLPSGIGRYSLGIAEAFANRTLPYDVEFLISQQFESQLANRFYPFKTVSSNVRFLSLKEIAGLTQFISNSGASLFHNVSFAAIRTPEGVRSCMTLHDLNHLHFGSIFQQAYYQFLTRGAALRADKILTVSKFARREISFWMGRDEREIEIVHAPCSAENFSESKSSVHSLNQNYFLLISNPKAFKNCELVFSVYQRYRKRVSEPLKLLTNVSPKNLSPGVEVVKPNDDELSRLMNGARAFLFPSLYEGYGMAFREALCLGTPGIVSDIPPHREGFDTSEKTWLKFLDPNCEGPWVDALVKADLNGMDRVPLSERTVLRDELGLKTFGDRMDRVYRTVLGLPV